MELGSGVIELGLFLHCRDISRDDGLLPTYTSSAPWIPASAHILP
jgi:hypothetical protein